MTSGRPHPLDCLVKDDSLFLLEAMIPFVDYSFKKPLIMLIKYQELNAILRCFDDPEYIAECGFDCHPKSSEDMIQSICNLMPGYGNNMKQAMQMMNMMQMMQNAQSQSSQNQEQQNPASSTHSDTYSNSTYNTDYDPTWKPNPSKNLYDSVMSILDEG